MAVTTLQDVETAAEKCASCPPKGPSLVGNVNQSVVASKIHTGEAKFAAHGDQDGINQSVIAMTGSNVTINGGVHNVPSSPVHDERSMILKWLYQFSSYPFAQRHTSYIEVANRFPGTGAWLLHEQRFTDWRDKAGSRLWCHGIFRSGKTILASIIVNHLRDRFPREQGIVPCLHIYFEHRDFENASESTVVSRLVASLLAQVVDCQDQVSSHARKAYQDHTIKQTIPSLQSFTSILEHEVKKFKRIFLVVDALEECPREPGMNCREQFLKVIAQLPSQVNVLYISRTGWKFENEIGIFDPIEISATDDDLKLYLNSRLRSCEGFKKVMSLGERDEVSPEAVIKMLMEKAQRRFLLAHLHTELLMKEFTVDGLRQRLNSLPDSPDSIFETAVKRIQIQDRQRRSLASEVLTWVVYALRPLTISELCHALAVKDGDNRLEDLQGRLVDEYDVTSACAGIITVDRKTSIVQLIHSTAKQYLQVHLNEHGILEPTQKRLTEKCLQYLSIGEFSKQCTTTEALSCRTKRYPLLNYAADHWHDHLKAAPDEALNSQALSYVIDEEKVSSNQQAMSDSSIAFESDMSSLHLATYFNSKALVDKLIAHSIGINAKTSRDETALHWASSFGYIDILNALIEGGANINATDKDGRTALHKAVKCQRTGALIALLKHSGTIDLNIVDDSGYTPLRVAAHYGYEPIVKLLVKSGANPDVQGGGEWSALRDAALHGHDRTVRYLISKGAKHVIQTPNGPWSVLCWAASEGYTCIVSLLIERKTDINATNSEGHSALRRAIDYGHGKVVWLLLHDGHNIDVNLPDHNGCSPLHAAVKRKRIRHSTIFWLLLEHNADPNARDSQGQTPLHIVVDEGDFSAAQVLLEQSNTDPNIKDSDGKTPLHLCAMKGDFVIARSLLGKRTTDPNLKDNDGRTALHIATQNSKNSVALVLLEKSVTTTNPDARDKKGRSALHLVAEIADMAAAWGLIQRNANVNLKDKGGRTALHYAAHLGHHQFVSFLLQYGADPTLVDGGKRTPLHWAITELAFGSKIHEKVVDHLIEGTNDMNVQDDEGLSALHIISSGSSISPDDRLASVLYLLKRGANPDCQDLEKKQTPLHMAVFERHKGLVVAMINAGANVNKQDEDGRSSLHLAAKSGDQFILDIILKSGKSRRDIKDNEGLTPYQLGVQNGHKNLDWGVGY